MRTALDEGQLAVPAGRGHMLMDLTQHIPALAQLDSEVHQGFSPSRASFPLQSSFLSFGLIDFSRKLISPINYAPFRVPNPSTHTVRKVQSKSNS